jgi:hypothetical protein
MGRALAMYFAFREDKPEEDKYRLSEDRGLAQIDHWSPDVLDRK